jgi:hypothetical protein
VLLYYAITVKTLLWVLEMMLPAGYHKHGCISVFGLVMHLVSFLMSLFWRCLQGCLWLWLESAPEFWWNVKFVSGLSVLI